jgi:hypothetical protein
MVKINNVPVLDENNCFLSNTTRAKARILLKDRKAVIFSKNPFMIQLKGERGSKRMKNRSNVTINLKEWVKENEEIYVQNMSNTQISMQINLGSGNFDEILIPRTTRPICLTRHFDVSDISRSRDFKKIFHRTPPILRILTDDEYLEYHSKKADSNGTTLESELEQSLMFDNMMINRQVEAPKDVTKLKDTSNNKVVKSPIDNPEDETEVVVKIHPRISGLMSQVNPDVPKAEKLKAGDLKEELELLAPELSVDDWSLVSVEGYWKTVKAYANEQLEKLTDSE